MCVQIRDAASLKDARTELRRLIRTGDAGEHVAPDKITLGAWIDQWVAAGAPGRRRKKVSQRTLERYEQLLRCHVAPTLGKRAIQQIRPDEIDALYTGLEGLLSPRTVHHVHTVLGACLSTAVRKGLLATSPIDRAEKVPSPGESNHGMTLDEDQLRAVVQGFRSSTHFPFVAVAAFTGARRNEILGLQCADLDREQNTPD
jgi:integrase